ncbi:MAG: hypothetical protein IT178_10635, partial [Acidobacteria bacterium]|nr:hypothetical protein [Acidobacteriota bacterium]
RRQQEADIARLIVSMGRPLTEAQLQLFFLIASVIVRHRPDGIASLADADVADAAGAMAATLEAATRGVIAQVPGANRVSEGLRRQVDGMLAEVGRDAGSRFAAEAALVLRGVERGAGHQDGDAGAGPEDYLTLLKRVLPPLPEAPRADPPPAIILP